ncbi:MAG: hypothetical protein U0903_08445 [Planctomycetales bacterium]
MMHHFFLLLVLLACQAVPLCAAGEPAAKVVLPPSGDAEAAPHGAGNLYAPDVLYDNVPADNHRFRMWYGAQGRDGHDQIYLAESPDGEHWTRKGLAIPRGTANHVNDPSVLRVGSRWYMFYTHTPRDVLDEIALAISADGLHWELHGTVFRPGKPDHWDGLSVGRPSVLHENGRFLLWYDGRKDFPPGSPIQNVPVSKHSSRAVGLAVSTDGKNFQRIQETPVFGEDAGAVHVTRLQQADAQKQYILTFESRAGTRFSLSTDGRHWSPSRLLLPKSSQPTEAFGHVTPFLWISPDQTQALLFYGASSAESWDHNRIAMFPLTRQELIRRLATP